MSVYYAFRGNLTFAGEKEARDAMAMLRGGDDESSLFHFPAELLAKLQPRDLRVEGATLHFSPGGDFFAGGEVYYRTCKLIATLAETALRGVVEAQLGEAGEGAVQITQYRAKPKAAKPKAAKPKAAKPKAAKPKAAKPKRRTRR